MSGSLLLGEPSPRIKPSQKIKKKLPAHSVFLKIDNVTVIKLQTAKFLGLLLDQHLSWVVHTSKAAKNSQISALHV